MAKKETTAIVETVETTEKVEMPNCFGKFWAADVPECQMCGCEADCKTACFAKPEEADEIKAGIVADMIEDATIEAKEAVEAEAVEKADTIDKDATDTDAAGGVSIGDIDTGSVTAKPTDRKKAPASTVTQAAFKKDDAGKLAYLPDYDFAGEKPDDVVVINAGDKVKVLSPRSKFKDQILEVKHYAVKYECIRCDVEGQKFTADFAPHLVEPC